jgi:CheY-like chemotaxis protein
MDGLDLMRRIGAEFEVPLISISGYAASLRHDEPALGDRHLYKPFTLQQLTDAVASVTA